jgi:hypothetical protein
MNTLYSTDRSGVKAKIDFPVSRAELKPRRSVCAKGKFPCAHDAIRAMRPNQNVGLEGH